MSRLTFKKEFQNPGEDVNCACIDMHTYNRVVNEKEEHYYLAGEVIDKLADFEDKQEQGLLIELKLKPGDKFYMIQCGFVVPHIVVRIDISEDGIEYDAFGVAFTEDEIGKTIFLTEAEAEEALAKMGE